MSRIFSGVKQDPGSSKFDCPGVKGITHDRFTLIGAVGDGVATAGEWWEGSFCSDCGLKREMKMLFHHTYYQWC